jgi:hypothetical protein
MNGPSIMSGAAAAFSGSGHPMEMILAQLDAPPPAMAGQA